MGTKESEVKWTPWPWHVEVDGWGNTDVISKDDWVVAEKVGADAHLIAAAPDLYEALEAAIDDCEYSMSPALFDECKAALAKARGE